MGEYFMINSSTGFLSQVKHFDYEDTEIQCNLGKGGGFVKIIAEVNRRFFLFKMCNLNRIIVFNNYMIICLLFRDNVDLLFISGWTLQNIKIPECDVYQH